jgi:hypothetical protein
MVSTCCRYPKAVLSDEDVGGGYKTCPQCRKGDVARKVAKVCFIPLYLYLTKKVQRVKKPKAEND